MPKPNKSPKPAEQPAAILTPDELAALRVAVNAAKGVLGRADDNVRLAQRALRKLEGGAK